MQKVVYLKDLGDYTKQLGKYVIAHISDGQVETFESFDDFDLIAFDWYDLEKKNAPPSQILIYIDTEYLLFFCENEASFEVASSLFEPDETNEHGLYIFFRNLLRGGTKRNEALEGRIAELDASIADKVNTRSKSKLFSLRNEVMRGNRYYEQLEYILEAICVNDNNLLSKGCSKHFEIQHNRIVRLLSQTNNLREYVTQVRESYQAQIGIEQNNLMKVFTLVTSIFMPLTLIAGWYGMNVQMPETQWKYGYLFVAGLCAVAAIIWLIIFKRKKWFK